MNLLLSQGHEKQVMLAKIEEIQGELVEIVTTKRYEDPETQVWEGRAGQYAKTHSLANGIIL